MDSKPVILGLAAALIICVRLFANYRGVRKTAPPQHRMLPTKVSFYDSPEETKTTETEEPYLSVSKGRERRPGSREDKKKRAQEPQF